MNWPAFAKRLLLDDGRITQREAQLIKRAILADHVVDRAEVEFLVDLKRSAREVHPDFDSFLFEVLRRAVLRDGVVSDAEARWLRGLFRADGKVSAEEAQFLRDLKQQAKSVGPEFEQLCRDYLGPGTPGKP
jgi:hypothetical protein